MPQPRRSDRLRREPAKSDFRSQFQRDRDRILYTYAFRRLAGVTQVVEPVEGHIFHNRLTHTLEVAQVARRIAERIAKQQRSLAASWGGVDPDVVEAAAFAHDLGHPPFGHVAEVELDRLSSRFDPDGFEGNAQSFRIVCRLAAHREGYRGLNLTRATLRAVLKYPWHRTSKTTDPERHRKFGAYRSEAEEFRAALNLPRAGGGQSAEAAIMDFADDVAYSVHDFDDFCRAGLIPIHFLKNEKTAFDNLVADWIMGKRVSATEIDPWRDSLRNFLGSLFIDEPYVGSFDQRAELRSQTSQLIGASVNAVRLRPQQGNGRPLEVDDRRLWEQKFLKWVVWRYVIKNRRLASIQHGQRAVIQGLFEDYLTAVLNRDADMIPPLFQDVLAELPPRRSKNSKATSEEARLAVDIVAHFTDDQAAKMFARLRGTAIGSVTESMDS
jgi:dGTPase